MASRIRQVVTLLLAIAMVGVAALVQTDLTGPPLRAVSSHYPTYVVPAGYAFSMWAPILLLSVAFGFYQLVSPRRESTLLERTGWAPASAFLATSVWMLVFQQSWLLPSVLVMSWLLASLAFVIVRIRNHPLPLDATERWLVRGTFSLFLGWITVATVANVGQTLVALQWNGGLSRESWSVALLALTAVAGSAVTVYTRGSLAYAAGVTWGLTGIAVHQLGWRLPSSSLAVGAVAVAAALIVAVTPALTRLPGLRAPYPHPIRFTP